MQQRKYESWVKKIEEIKQLVEFRQHTNTAFEEKMQFSCFPVLPGSAGAQVIWCGTVKYLLIAYFLGNISAKISKFDQSCVKPKVGRFETEEERKRKEPPQYVTNHPGQSSLLLLAGRVLAKVRWRSVAGD